MMDIRTEFRIFTRILQETLGGIKRTSWMNVVIVITMASILSIFGTLFAFVIETQLFLENHIGQFKRHFVLNRVPNLRFK